jgi:uncharacterized OB-fold protein
MPLDPITKITELRSWPGDIPVASTYTAGIAGERFLRILKEEGKLLGTHCDRCNITYAPARLFCERCLTGLNDAWIEVGTMGTIETFTTLHVELDGTRRLQPQIIAAIRLDGADTVLIHRLNPDDPGTPEIGARVRAVLLPEDLRVGSILDIDYFTRT